MNILNSIEHMLSTITNGTHTGTVVVTAGAILIPFITPITGLLIACVSCSIVDMLYGVQVAKKFKQKVTSKKNWKGTIIKIKDEFTLILLAHVLEYAVNLNDHFILSGGVCIIICLTELLSILENLNTLKPNGPWRIIRKFLKQKGEQLGINIDDEDYKNNNEVDNKQ